MTFEEYCKSNPNICEPELCNGLCEKFFNVIQEKDKCIEELEKKINLRSACDEVLVKNPNWKIGGGEKK